MAGGHARRAVLMTAIPFGDKSADKTKALICSDQMK